jgi:hypothetical protein
MFLDVTLQPRQKEKEQTEVVKLRYNWNYENNINSGKQLIDLDNPQEFKYSQWRTNSALSNHNETLSNVQDMNLNPHLTDKMHYHYMFYSVRKATRYGKKKTEEDKKLEAQINKEEELIKMIQEYYKFSYKKSVDAFKILNKNQLSYIKDILTKGKD